MIHLLPPRPSLHQADPDSLVSRFRTGDLLLFSGRGLPSDTIRLFTRSHWSHVGMLVCLPDYEEPLLLEATAFGDAADVRTGKATAGVVLVPARTRIREYRGEVAWRERQGEPLSLSGQRRVARLVRHFSYRPYKHFMQALLRDVVTGFRLRPDLSGVFCSELVAECYRRLGWLPRHERASHFVPGTFGSDALQLVNGKMAPPVLLKAEEERRPQTALAELKRQPWRELKASAAYALGMSPTGHQSAAHGTPPLPR